MTEIKRKRYLVLTMLLGFVFSIHTILYAQEKKDAETISHFQRGEEFFSKGKYKEAIEEFKHALAEMPLDVQTNKKLGLSYLYKGDINLAIGQLSATLIIKHDDTETIIALGEAFSLNKQFDESIKLYRKAITIEPNNVWFRYKLGEVLSWVKKYDESIQEYRKILSLEPKNNGVRIILGEVYAFQAKEDGKPELFKQSSRELEHVINNDPKNFLANKKLGWVYLEKKELRRAIKTLEKAFHLNPEEYETRMLLAQAYGWRGQYKRAIKIYNDILAETPNDIGTLYRLGEVLSWRNRYDESIACYEKILAIEPTNLWIKTRIARVYALKQDYIRAGEIFNKILEEDPKNIGALLGEAELERFRWRWGNSINKYRTILEFDPVNTAAKEGLKEVDLIASPSTQANSGYFVDSYDLERIWAGDSFQFRLFNKTLFTVGIMHWRFHQKGVPKINRNDFSFKIKQHFSNSLDLEIGYTANDYSNGPTNHSLASSAIINLKEKAFIYLSYTKDAPIVDSILTINKDFSANVFGFGMDYHFFKNLSVQCGFSNYYYSDDNKKALRNFQLSFHLLRVPQLDLRLKYEFLNFKNYNNLYWSPGNFETYSLIVNWEQKIAKKTYFGLNGTGIHFAKRSEWGRGVRGYLNLGLSDSLNVLFTAAYFNAEMKTPWLGKSLDLKIIYTF